MFGNNPVPSSWGQPQQQQQQQQGAPAFGQPPASGFGTGTSKHINSFRAPYKQSHARRDLRFGRRFWPTTTTTTSSKSHVRRARRLSEHIFDDTGHDRFWCVARAWTLSSTADVHYRHIWSQQPAWIGDRTLWSPQTSDRLWNFWRWRHGNVDIWQYRSIWVEYC